MTPKFAKAAILLLGIAAFPVAGASAQFGPMWAKHQSIIEHFEGTHHGHSPLPVQNETERSGQP